MQDFLYSCGSGRTAGVENWIGGMPVEPIQATLTVALGVQPPTF
jgi:hypothetical protein